MFLKKLLIVASVFMSLAIAQGASAAIFSAQGSGWCSADNYCNSTESSIANTAAGYSDSYRNFFAFDLSTLSGTVSGATLSIWNDSSNSANSNLTDYVLHAATSISYSGLSSGAVLGSINMWQENNNVSRFVDITLNQAGLTALQTAAGQKFLFGGMTPDSGVIFGFTNGQPAATLTVQTSTAVPEPGSVALLALGLGAVGLARRRKAG